MGREANIPAWYATVLFLAAGVILGVIAYIKLTSRDRYRYHWLSLSLLFIYMSADEAAIIHEEIGNFLGTQLPNSIFRHGWFVFGGMVVIFLALVYFRFFRTLPIRTRYLFLASSLIFVGGAIGVELLALPYENGRQADLLFAVFVDIEELLENIGLVLFISALLDYMYSTMNGVEFMILKPIAKSDQPRPAG